MSRVKEEKRRREEEEEEESVCISFKAWRISGTTVSYEEGIMSDKDWIDMLFVSLYMSLWKEGRREEKERVNVQN